MAINNPVCQGLFQRRSETLFLTFHSKSFERKKNNKIKPSPTNIIIINNNKLSPTNIIIIINNNNSNTYLKLYMFLLLSFLPPSLQLFPLATPQSGFSAEQLRLSFFHIRLDVHISHVIPSSLFSNLASECQITKRTHFCARQQLPRKRAQKKTTNFTTTA